MNRGVYGVAGWLGRVSAVGVAVAAATVLTGAVSSSPFSEADFSSSEQSNK